MTDTDINPAAELRAAADKVRALAQAAAPDGRTRWMVGHTLGSKSRVVIDDHEQPTVLIETWAKHREQVDDYLTTFASPIVAEAVADWLETTATYVDSSITYPTHVVRAFAAARQILGSDQ
ncbi:hypothetical protein Srufu_079040 (plasmid) [Streptomyces libani subsp. rufus]|nr:hypothetical protein Srufu_079040 [Streptomyces libani subsp. rufus]